MAALDSCVAIIDDDASVRRALLRLLRAYSISAETFCSGQDFLESLSVRRPRCIVLDQHMPEMTGLELQRNLRARGVDIPTIIITAHDQPHLRELFQAEGVIECLLKPLKENELLLCIDKAINSSERQYNTVARRSF